MSRAAVVLCPGRGSYGAAELGYLSRPAPASVLTALDPAIDRADGLRTARGDRTIRDLDGARKLDADFHLGQHAAGLTFACTAFDFLRLDRERIDVVATGGNSMGWYSALFAGGALGLDDAFDLVETMGGMTRDGRVGGQVIYPLIDDDWHPDGERSAAVGNALSAVTYAGHEAGWSIVYGGYAVLWADDPGVERLLDLLPPVKLGQIKYPFELPGHSAFHSPLMAAASTRGLDRLSTLGWTPPATPLIDGRGHVWQPLGTDPAPLCRYTLEHQVLETFDFRATVRVALREFAPDLIVALGPGDTMGAAVAHVLIEERWQGIDSRAAFTDRQRDDPFVIALGRAEQAETVTLAAD